jgi:uncharacterized protein (DUF362 family)
MEKVSKIKVKDDLRNSILEAVDRIGGFKKFINPGETILLKPNFNTADSFPASTDLEFLKTVVELIYEYDPKIIMIGDSSTMSINTRETMEKIGVFELERMEKPPRIYVFEERKWIKKKIPGAKYLKNVSVTNFLDRADKIILLPCLKTHFLAQYTGALKLSVGFMKPYQRVPLHARHLQDKIAELNKIVPADLVIMDARKCFINKGPAKGKIKEPNLILASDDRVAIDVEGIKIIQSYRGNSLKGINPLEVLQIKRALELGIGKN